MTRKITRVLQRKEPRLFLKRMAGYARVSSGKDEMLHSLSAQISYYSELIRQNPEWVYAGVYADDGSSYGQKPNNP